MPSGHPDAGNQVERGLFQNETASLARADQWIQKATSPAVMFGGITWLTLGVVALLLSSGGTPEDARRVTQALSVLNIAIGVWIFWTHGGRRITAAGIWSMSLGVYAGGGGLWAIPLGRQPGLLPALCVVYFGQIVTHFGFWARSAPTRAHGRFESNPAVTSWGIWIGTVLLTVPIALITLHVDASVASIQGDIDVMLMMSAFAGALIFAASLLFHGRGRVGYWKLVVVAGAFLLYARFFWSGGGRLILVSLGVCMAMPACMRFRGRTIKAAILLATVPALLVFGWIRLEGGGGAPTGSLLNSVAIQEAANRGLGSVWVPLPNFGRLLELESEHHLTQTWGSTFVASAVFFVPRRLWHGRPWSFNGDANLVPIIAPTLVRTGFTTAALAQGEWLYNFGYLGLLFMVPVVGFGIRKLDGWLANASSRPVRTHRDLLSFCAAICFAAGMADLAWGGSSTFVTRSIPRLAVIGAVLVLDSRSDSASRRGRAKRLRFASHR
jgi:hypothetical protein